MTKDEALQIVSNLVTVVQKVRSNTAEVLGTDEVAEAIKADLCRWTEGAQGDKFLMLLADLSTGAKTLDGPLFFNLMVIANQLEPSIALVYALRWEEELPTPNPEMIHWF